MTYMNGMQKFVLLIMFFHIFTIGCFENDQNNDLSLINTFEIKLLSNLTNECSGIVNITGMIEYSNQDISIITMEMSIDNSSLFSINSSDSLTNNNHEIGWFFQMNTSLYKNGIHMINLTIRYKLYNEELWSNKSFNINIHNIPTYTIWGPPARSLIIEKSYVIDYNKTNYIFHVINGSGIIYLDDFGNDWINLSDCYLDIKIDCFSDYILPLDILRINDSISFGYMIYIDGEYNDEVTVYDKNGIKYYSKFDIFKRFKIQQEDINIEMEKNLVLPNNLTNISNIIFHLDKWGDNRYWDPFNSNTTYEKIVIYNDNEMKQKNATVIYYNDTIEEIYYNLSFNISIGSRRYYINLINNDRGYKDCYGEILIDIGGFEYLFYFNCLITIPLSHWYYCIPSFDHIDLTITRIE